MQNIARYGRFVQADMGHAPYRLFRRTQPASPHRGRNAVDGGCSRASRPPARTEHATERREQRFVQALVALTPYGHGQSELSRKHEGTGLGLPLSLALLKLHDGTMRIESTKYVGTKLTLSFPPERVVSPQDGSRNQHTKLG